ncbi:MAG TPA: gamma-glutamylcyclotransferase family protein [Candidatus Acidoferrales bacterium]|nr:gamma-glutamylcyclotransferase family protein [Candidatus Acidoferrales bacterium]
MGTCADLFVYGTLRDVVLVKQLTGRVFQTTSAQLPRYRKISSHDTYAYIIPDESATTEGLLLLGVDAASLVALDRYEGEGELYRRTAVEVVVDGTPRSALTYVGIKGAHPVVRPPRG